MQTCLSFSGLYLYSVICSPAGYSPELSAALATYQIPDGKDDEMALSRQFDQPDKSRKWREGLLKSSFNYLLLDPRLDVVFLTPKLLKAS